MSVVRSEHGAESWAAPWAQPAAPEGAGASASGSTIVGSAVSTGRIVLRQAYWPGPAGGAPPAGRVGALTAAASSPAPTAKRSSMSLFWEWEENDK
jgi:hypothetical protein